MRDFGWRAYRNLVAATALASFLLTLSGCGWLVNREVKMAAKKEAENAGEALHIVKSKEQLKKEIDELEQKLAAQKEESRKREAELEQKIKELKESCEAVKE